MRYVGRHRTPACHTTTNPYQFIRLHCGDEPAWADLEKAPLLECGVGTTVQHLSERRGHPWKTKVQSPEISMNLSDERTVNRIGAVLEAKPLSRMLL